MITGMPRIAIAVRDMDAAIATFRDGFAMPVNEVAGAVKSLGIRIAICAPGDGSNVELMSPADPDAPLNASLQQFIDRRGEGLFALMLEAPDPDVEADDLLARGLGVLPLMPGAGGRDVHPRSTHGVLIRVYPTVPADGAPRPQQLVTGITRVTVAVRDFDHAVEVYRDQFAMAIEELPPDAERGVRAARCRPGTGGVIEIVSPLDGTRPFASRIADLLAEREGMFEIVLQSDELTSLGARLSARGVAVGACPDAPDALEVGPGAAFGATIRLEQRSAAG
jgi:catechol 2,3-dioxygenase-like lactoylglutathione lyase family enzyme